MAELQIGNVVIVKSNTMVPMTIERELKRGWVACVWFDYDNRLRRGEFAKSTLQKVRD